MYNILCDYSLFGILLYTNNTFYCIVSELFRSKYDIVIRIMYLLRNILILNIRVFVFYRYHFSN